MEKIKIMRSFLVINKKPIIKWSQLPDNTFFEGKIPEGYSLGISPSKGYIIIDVDKHNGKNGFKKIPNHLVEELEFTLNYPTKNKGRHYWFKYTGNKDLMNKSSKLGIDLRTEKGYVVWYLDEDIRSWEYQIQETSKELNEWLEEHFTFKQPKLLKK